MDEAYWDIIAGTLGVLGYMLGGMAGIRKASCQVLALSRNIILKLQKGEIEALLISFLYLLIFVLPMPVSYCLVSGYYKSLDESWLICGIMIVATLYTGVQFTNEWWGQIADFEKNNINNKIQLLGDDYIVSLFEKLCKEVNREDLGIWVSEEEEIEASVITTKIVKKSSGLKKVRKVKGVVISPKCMELPEDELCALLEHEIMHVVNKDDGTLELFREIIRNALMILGLIVICCFMGVAVKIPVIGILLVILVGAFLLVYVILMIIFVCIGERYIWEQMKEIRADRMACEINGVTKAGMLNLLKRLQKENKISLSWIDRIHMKYYRVEPHPCIERRIYLIENYRKWSIEDYFIHTIQAMKWFFTGKGWTGEIYKTEKRVD